MLRRLDFSLAGLCCLGPGVLLCLVFPTDPPSQDGVSPHPDLSPARLERPKARHMQLIWGPWPPQGQSCVRDQRRSQSWCKGTPQSADTPGLECSSTAPLLGAQGQDRPAVATQEGYLEREASQGGRRT